MTSTQLTLAIVSALAVFAILFSIMFVGFYLLSRDSKPPLPTYGPTRSQRARKALAAFARVVYRRAQVWFPVLSHLARDCGSTVLVAVRKRLPRRRASSTQTIAPPFPDERVWRFAVRHRSLHAAGHLVLVSDYPDGKSRAVLRPRTRLSQRVDLGELNTGPASDLEFLRLAKAYRIA